MADVQAQEPSSIGEMLSQHWQEVNAPAPQNEASTEPEVETKGEPPQGEPVEATPEPESNTEKVKTDSEAEDDLAKYIEEMFAAPAGEADESAEELEDEDDETGEIPELDVKSKANKRIRKLNARTKEAEAKAQAAEERLSGLAARVDKQAELLQRAFKALKQREAPKPEPRPTDPSDPRAQLEALIEEKYGKRLSATEQELQRYRQVAAEAERNAELSQVENRLREEARTLRPQLLPGLPEDAYKDETLGNALDEFLMTRAYGLNKAPADVVHETREFVKAVLKWGFQGARSRGKKLQSNPDVPSVSRRGGGATKQSTGLPLYSQAQLHAAKYPNDIAALRDNFSRLKNVEPEGGFTS